MKRAWTNYTNLSSLVAKIYSSIKQSSLSTGNITPCQGKSYSWGFRIINNAETFLFHNSSQKVGNGQSIEIFNSPWVNSCIPLADSHLPLRVIQRSFIHHFIHPIPNPKWNVLLIKVSLYFKDAQSILRLEIPLSQEKKLYDFEPPQIWKLYNKNRSCILQLHILQSSPQNMISYKKLWHLPIPTKVETFPLENQQKLFLSSQN